MAVFRQRYGRHGPANSLHRESTAAPAQRACGKCPDSRDAVLSWNQPAEAETAENFEYATVQIAQQTAFQADVILRTGEQVLHHRPECRTAARELDHPRGHCAEHVVTVKDALRE